MDRHHPQGPTHILAARDLVKAFGERRVLDAISCEFAAGSVTALLGPNGAGKSTLLRCLSGATPLDSGEILLEGRVCDPTTTEHWRSVLGVLDDHAWLPGLTLRDHLMLVGNTADAAIERVGLTGFGDRRPASLSSGQRQRAALALVLVRPWQVLLLDEPERHLDDDGVDLLVELIAEWSERAVVFATHSDDLVERTGAEHLTLGAR